MDNRFNFKEQIKSDIDEYKEKYGSSIPSINRDSWAFNFWIMDKFFYVDENEIENYILENRDYGIDCYYFYKETKELYLIQNKYFNSTTPLTANYLNDDVFSRSFNLLESGTYTRSPKLQQIYNENKSNPDFKVTIQIYVTNNLTNKDVYNAVEHFNELHLNDNKSAEIYYLNDIYSKYYDEEPVSHSEFYYKLKRITKDTTLSITSSTLKSKTNINSEYIIVPITDLYDMTKSAKEKEYNLVQNNVRDYMGSTTFNKGISDTLNDVSELENFLYYNNGITIICDNLQKNNFVKKGSYILKNPQIVNGCQTVNTIFEVLNMIGDSQIIKDKYSKCYVMVKILVIDDERKKELYKNIVLYNNSQNSIKKKVFEAVTPRFIRLRNEYKKKGFLLCISPSDEYQYKHTYKSSHLIQKAQPYLDLFQLNLKNTKDFCIPIDKFLQVLLAYTSGAINAYQKKSDLLKVPETDLYLTVRDFILKESVNSDLLLLYLLYLKSEQKKSERLANGEDGRFPVSYFLIEGFSKYEFNSAGKSISQALSTKEKIDSIINLYTELSERYYSDYFKKKNEDYGYNDLTKQPIDNNVFEQIHREIQTRYDNPNNSITK